MPVNFARIVLGVPALLWSISFHEFCHGYAAYKLGDSTAKIDGRLSLNPLAHIDPVGGLCLLLFGFGWARPVPINPGNFKSPRRDLALVSLAGPAGNILTAFICARLLLAFPPFFKMLGDGMVMFILIMVRMNVGLAAFNLIPVPPLDGSRVLYALLPREAMRAFDRIERYGMLIIILLIATNLLQKIMLPYIAFIEKIIGIGM